jgi:hypothetical protein
MAASWTDADRERIRARVVGLVERFPGVTVEDGWGHTGLLCGRHRFAWLLVDHHGDGRLALCAKAPLGEVEALVAQDPARYFVPAYVKHWVGVELWAVEPDWDEVAALLEQAWRLRAGKRVIAAFDGG